MGPVHSAKEASERKERQKIYAQTFIPSIGVFEDKPGPIQLASKAKDSEVIGDEKVKEENAQDVKLDCKSTKYSITHGGQLSGKTVSKTKLLNYDSYGKTQKGMIKEDISRASEHLKDLATTENRPSEYSVTKSRNPLSQSYVDKSQNFIKQPATKFLPKEARRVTSISACTWTPETVSGNGIKLQEKRKMENVEDTSKSTLSSSSGVVSSENAETGSSSRSSSRCSVGDKSSSATAGRPDSVDSKQSSRFSRSFNIQSGRSSIKSESKCG